MDIAASRDNLNEPSGASSLQLWLTAVVVGGAFFLSEHDFGVSLRENFALEADHMESAALGGNVVRRVAFLSVACLGLVQFVLPAKRPFRLASLPAMLMLLFVGWCGLSVLWSIDPGMTVRRYSVLVCCFVGVLGASRQFSPRQLLLMTLAVSAAYLAVGFASELAFGTFRPHAGEYRFSGTLHPNTQGMHLAALCLSAFCLSRDVRRGRLLLMGLFCIGFFFLLLTKSRTSAGGVLLALAPLWLLHAPLHWKLLVGLGGTWSLSAAALVVLLFGIDVKDDLTGAALMGRQEQAESLTGRLPLWTQLADYMAQRPLTGFGYESFWVPRHIDAVSSEQQWGIREAHSAYIEATLSVGLVGTLLILTAVAVAMHGSAARYLASGESAYGFTFGMCVFGLINSCTESGMIAPMFVTFAGACGIAQLAAKRQAAGDAAEAPAARHPSQPANISDLCLLTTDH